MDLSTSIIERETRMPKARPGTPKSSVTIIQVKDALCSQTDPEVFFPEPKSDYNDYGNARFAKRICARCDYTLPCLTTALSNKEEFGVWGGSTAKDRTYIRTKAQAEFFVRKLKLSFSDDAKK
jgi:WhiB family redox-sensing transcriptional regulator